MSHKYLSYINTSLLTALTACACYNTYDGCSRPSEQNVVEERKVEDVPTLSSEDLQEAPSGQPRDYYIPSLPQREDSEELRFDRQFYELRV